MGVARDGDSSAVWATTSNDVLTGVAGFLDRTGERGMVVCSAGVVVGGSAVSSCPSVVGGPMAPFLTGETGSSFPSSPPAVSFSLPGFRRLRPENPRPWPPSARAGDLSMSGNALVRPSTSCAEPTRAALTGEGGRGGRARVEVGDGREGTIFVASVKALGEGRLAMEDERAARPGRAGPRKCFIGLYESPFEGEVGLASVLFLTGETGWVGAEGRSMGDLELDEPTLVNREGGRPSLPLSTDLSVEEPCRVSEGTWASRLPTIPLPRNCIKLVDEGRPIVPLASAGVDRVEPTIVNLEVAGIDSVALNDGLAGLLRDVLEKRDELGSLFG